MRSKAAATGRPFGGLYPCPFGHCLENSAHAETLAALVLLEPVRKLIGVKAQWAWIRDTRWVESGRLLFSSLPFNLTRLSKLPAKEREQESWSQ